MRLIKEYHAKFNVRRGNEVLSVTANLTDWMNDLEFLKEAAKHIGVDTVGGVISSLMNRKVSNIGCNGLHVNVNSNCTKLSHEHAYDWDMKLMVKVE